MKKSILFILSVCCLSVTMAQLRPVPAVVKSTIAHHYPDAKNVTYEDYLTRYRVHLVNGQDSLTVGISSGGQIKSVSTRLKKSAIPAAVQLGYSKSKYADWTITSVDKVDAPGTDTQYVLGVDGGSLLQKRNLYFSLEGQLLKERQAL